MQMKEEDGRVASLGREQYGFGEADDCYGIGNSDCVYSTNTSGYSAVLYKLRCEADNPEHNPLTVL